MKNSSRWIVYHDNDHTMFDSSESAHEFYERYCQSFGLARVTDGDFILLRGHFPRPFKPMGGK